MQNNRIIEKAIATLTESERKLIWLLTNEKICKKDVLSFLTSYDIDNETAVTSFLINELLDRFEIEAGESECVPRIRGLKEYFRFHNISAVMKCPTGQTLLDVDLYLKLRYPNEIRPFTSLDGVISKERFSSLFGCYYTKKILSTLKPVRLQNREYLIPDDYYLADIVTLGLYYSMYCGGSAAKTICYIYDMYRYCSDKNTTAGLKLIIVRKSIRHKLRRLKRWLLK